MTSELKNLTVGAFSSCLCFRMDATGDNELEEKDMAKMIAIYKTPKDPAAFDKHYYEIHVPLAKRLPGLIKYETNKGAVTTITGGVSPYLIGTLYFEDLDAIKNAFASEVGRACAADRRRLASNEEVEIYIFDTHDQ